MRPIREHRGVTRAIFEAEIMPVDEPAVLRGLVADWPIVAAATASDADLAAYLRARATDVPGEVWFAEPELEGRFGFTDAIDGFNHDRKLATVDQLLDLLLRQRGAAAPYAMYAGALPVARFFPALRGENPMPLLDADREMLVSLWLGNRTKTAAHWDWPRNLACVVAGRRRFTLFPTDQVANLYIGPVDFTLAGQPSSLVDVEDPDLDHFPKFRDAQAAALVAELEPGDALYIPSLWWHAVRSRDEIGAMVNFWWRDDAATLPPFLALLHATLALRDVPDAERQRWRALFDHWAFAADGDPAAHLPATARGILRPGNPDDDTAVRERVARSLSPPRRS